MEKILFCLKRHCFTIALLLCTKATITTAFAQADSIGINYQAIARDTTGQPFSDTTINVKFSIWDAISNGNMNYSEEHFNVQTNKYGLFTLVIGSGTNQTTDFEDINWIATNKYLQVEIDLIPNGYIQMPGRTRFQGVPYARASYIAVTALDGWKTSGNDNLQPNAFLGTSSNDSLIIKTNSNNSIVIDQSGNVEITRGNVLIKNSTAAANEIEFNGTAPVDIVAHSELNIGTETANPIQIKTNNSAKVIIDTLGNVGIGAQTPTAKLDVAGTVRITDGTQGIGKILTSDATGLASWETLSLGTVTQVSADSLLPLFTTHVVDSSTTPHIEFTLANAAPYTIFGNDTSVASQPNYYKPILNSPLFENQGDTNRVLHGNAAGNLSWTKITNDDIASQAVDLTTHVNGTLPIINGGTNATTLGDAGSVAYSNGTAYNFTQVGNSGQVLESTGTGAPIWSKRVLTITGDSDSIITATTTDTSNYTLSVALNDVKQNGVVLAGYSYPNMVWKTDAAGYPAWRNDSSGVSYVMGTGLTLFGNMINSTWTQSGNNIYNNNTANVGIGINTPVNKLDVEGGVAIGATYSGLSTAPTNGAIIQGKVGIGTIAPGAQLHVQTVNGSESAGYYENSFTSSSAHTLVAASNVNSTKATLFTTNTGTSGGALLASINNAGNNASTIESTTTGTGDAINAENSGTSGKAGTFKITNPNSIANSALYVSSKVNTSGKAGHFELTDTSNTASSLLAETAGKGNSIEAKNTGKGRAGRFEINNAANTSDAVYITTIGGTGANGSKGLSVLNSGLGSNVSNYAGYFETNGSGTGNSNIAGYFSATGASNNYAGIFANGNVGIGTTQPTSLLHVAGAMRIGVGGTTTGSILFNNATNTNTVILRSGVTSTAYTLTLPTAQGATNSVLANDGAGALSWVTAGSLGAWANIGNAGTTAPTANIGSTINNNFIGTTGGTDFAFATSSLERMRITSAGRIGIGTKTPGSQLHIVYDSAGLYSGIAIHNTSTSNVASTSIALVNDANFSGGISMNSSNSVLLSGPNTMNIGTNSPAKLKFGTSGVTRMTISELGNVGIGTETLSSTAKLHIVNNVPYANEIRIQNTDTSFAASSMLSLYNNTSSSAFINFGSSKNTSLAGKNGLAIGTIPAGKVEFYTKNTARVTIDTIGNVGIGTVTPGSKLEVNGAIASAVASYPTFSGGASYILDATNSIIIITGTGTGPTTFTLPLANTCPGRVYYFKNVSTASTVSLSKSGSDTIDSSITYAVLVNGGAILASDGVSKWYIIGKY